MESPATPHRRADDAGVGFAGYAFGLATLTMVLFPFLIPALALVALIAVPALPIALAAGVFVMPALVVGAVRRSYRNRRRARLLPTGPQPARSSDSSRASRSRSAGARSSATWIRAS